MIVRLGNVIYWGCSGVAAILVVASAWSASTGQQGTLIVAGGAAALFWLFGRASRYVLAGT